MKKLIAIACIALAGCASQPKGDMALQQIDSYGISSQAEAERGSITWESRYIRLFEIAGSVESQILRNGYRRAYSDMIPVARRFDAKQITREEFEDARRVVRLTLDSTMDDAKRAWAEQDRARSAEIAQIIREGQERNNQIMQDYQRTLIRPQTNCTSSIYGNTMQTNCR